MSDSMLYEPCPNHDEVKSPTGACILCGGVGMVPTGVTRSQLDKFARRELALKGDPGIPRETRHNILAALSLHCRRAIAALQSEVES